MLERSSFVQDFQLGGKGSNLSSLLNITFGFKMNLENFQDIKCSQEVIILIGNHSKLLFLFYLLVQLPNRYELRSICANERTIKTESTLPHKKRRSRRVV